MSSQKHTNAHVFKGWLPPVVVSVNLIVFTYVCKDATSLTKANREADVPNEGNVAREGGIVQPVPSKVNVLHAYIIQGDRELTTPSLYVTMCWQEEVGCFVMFTVFPLLFKNPCITRCQEWTTTGEAAVLQQAAPLCCAALLLLQGSFRCMEPDGEQRTQRGLGTAMYCSARSCAMHTHSLPFLRYLWQSLNLLLYLSTPLWPPLVSFVLLHLFSSSLLIRYVLFSTLLRLTVINISLAVSDTVHLNDPALCYSYAHL